MRQAATGARRVQSRARYGVMTAFNTVVLFDVENLLGAPAGWKKAAAKLSFGDILTQLRRRRVGGDWRVRRQPCVRELGAGVHGHAAPGDDRERCRASTDLRVRQSRHKNAADIELVIDALDLAYLRGGLSTFVLVTRDGGFSALARKLHELGKTVVVCADSALLERAEGGRRRLHRTADARGGTRPRSTRSRPPRSAKPRARCSRPASRYSTRRGRRSWRTWSGWRETTASVSIGKGSR